MASALDLIAAIGQTFGVRPEAVRALPRPPDAAFVLCVGALLWACLWRGWLRWGALALLAANGAIYVAAPLPIAAFDGDLRAVFSRDEDGRWTLVERPGRSTYVRDRLGGMLGLGPAQLDRIAPPESCGETGCVLAHGVSVVRTPEALPTHCATGALLITTFDMPPDAAACVATPAVIDPTDRALLGGGLVYATEGGLNVTRAWPSEVRRAWTPTRGASSGAQE